jgi:flagellar hook protein FlgE
MNTSFYNGVIGMKTSQFGIDVWGGNIANANTNGYKQQLVDFSSLFSRSVDTHGVITSDIGVGASIPTTSLDISQGNIIATDSNFDISLNGDGWLPIRDGNNRVVFTRTGAFTRDIDGVLVNPDGNKLQVVSANNLNYIDGEWVFDTTIDTSNLITTDPNLTQITLPDNITFPSRATQVITIGGNLQNSAIAPDTIKATSNSDFGVLYDRNGVAMNLQNLQDVVFGFGENIFFEDRLIRYESCISDDVADGKDVNIDFDINGVNIKTTLPDGSNKKSIIDAIAKKIDQYNKTASTPILYSKSDNSIQFRDSDSLTIINRGDYINSASMQRIVYNNTPSNNTEFKTMQNFIDILQSLANNVYSNVSVGIDENGKLYIKNDNDGFDVIASSFSTSKSNPLFIQNLGNLGNVIKPNTSSTSVEFTQSYQGFSGDIIDKDGNINELKFDFIKTAIVGENTIWRLDLSQLSPSGEVISTTSKDLLFDKNGGLLTPNEISIDNNGVSTTIKLGQNFSGITSNDKVNSGFYYSQDGLVDGYLEGYDIAQNGEIIAKFSNAQSGVLAQIPIYHFKNEGGLDSLGGGVFIQSNNSGEPILFTDNNGNYMSGAIVKNYSLESSNVDMTQALTELIVMQKAYDANSKSIKTSDQFIQKAINMKK